MDDNAFVPKKEVKKEPEYVTEKIEVYLDPIKSEWDRGTLIVTARNDSKHTVTMPKIKFRFGGCDTPSVVVVKRVQRKLNNLGFKAGSADGIFGGKTAAAISRYQKTKNLTVTGKITDDLLRRLGVENTQDFMDGILGIPL